MDLKKQNEVNSSMAKAPPQVAKFPEYNRAFGLFFQNALHELMRSNDPILSRMPTSETESIGPSAVCGYESFDHQIEPMRMETTFVLTYTAIHHTDVSELATALYSAAEEGLKSLMPQFFAIMDKICDESGNTVDAKGLPFSWDQVIDGIEKMQIHFDEFGQARLPEFFVAPAMKEKTEVIPMTIEQKARFDSVIARKRDEFFAQKRVRKLS